MTHEPNRVVVVATTLIPVHVLLNLTHVVRMRRTRKRDREHQMLIRWRERDRDRSPIGAQKRGLGIERHDEDGRQHGHDGSR